MTEIRKADPAARRQALLLLALATLLGSLLILGWERYRIPFQDWLASEPGELAHRVKLVLLLAAVVLSAPLVAFAAHLWRLGARVRRAREFPPPGYRVVRDTAVVSGQAAMSRGRALGALALGLGAASVLVWLLLWRLARLLGARPAPRSVGAAPAGPTRRDI